MINRYSPKDVAAIWSDENKLEIWKKIESAATASMEQHGMVPKNNLGQKIAEVNVTVDAHQLVEKTTRHDVVAFLQILEESLGEDGRWVHYGMTSSDITDTTFAIQLLQSCKKISERLEKLIAKVGALVEEHAGTRTIGRTHGMHAELTTFGYIMAGHHQEISRCRDFFNEVLHTVSVGKISGAVGTNVHVPSQVESDVLYSLELYKDQVSSQIVSRDVFAPFFFATALLGSTLERLALQIRHWSRPEVAEIVGKPEPGYVGSSAMPHKVNPIDAEKICGLARVLRSYVSPALENVALWHEHDISHSSVERIIGPDASCVCAHMIDTMLRVLDTIEVDAHRMLKNCQMSGDKILAGNILLYLVRQGMSRTRAHSLVRKHSKVADKDFIYSLLNDPEFPKCDQIVLLREISGELQIESAKRKTANYIHRTNGTWR